MYIARILYPVKVLGPGNRIGIWFNGCIHHCTGCSNPELWEFQKQFFTSIEVLLDLVTKISENYPVDGFTLTGGDPFYQPETLANLLPELSKISEDIIVYTGYQYEELSIKYHDIVKQISVIIDGPYIQELNDGCLLRGSNNQRIIIRDDFKDYYNSYLKTAENKIQNFSLKDGMISVGIHSRNFDKDLDEQLLKNGKENV